MASEISAFSSRKPDCMQKEKSVTENYNEYNENFETRLAIKAFRLYTFLTYSCVANMREFKFV